MSKRFINSLGIFSLAAVSFVALGAYMPYCELSLGNDPRSWFPVVSTHHNAYHMWRIDHVAGLISKTLSTWSAHTFIPLSMAILCLGTYRVVRSVSLSHPVLATHYLTSWLISIGTTFIVLAVIGPDAITLSSLAWLPVFSLTLSALATVSRVGLAVGAAPLWLITLFISIEASIAANQLAPLTATVACLLGLTVFQPEERSPLPLRPLYLILALAFGPALYSSFTAPAAPFPDYPQLAHIVPDDGLAGIVRPLVGLDYPLQVVDRGAVQALYTPPSIALAVLAVLALWAFVIVRGLTTKTSRTLILASCAVAATAALDTVLPEQFAVISPLMSISRLLPWGTSLSLTPFALGLGAWLLCIGSGIWLQSSLRIFICMFVSFGALVTAQSAWWNPPLAVSDVVRISSDESLRTVALSPSLKVIETYEHSTPGFLAHLEEFKLLATQSMRSISLSDASFETHPVGNGRTLERVVDGSAHTRWTSNRNQQLGDELLTLRFSKPTPLRGIELDPGEYTTDFPRGITVTGGECVEEGAKQLAKLPSWQGALLFTSNGFPYFSAQSDVKILFGREEVVECLFIRQTGSAPFSWTVAELRTVP